MLYMYNTSNQHCLVVNMIVMRYYSSAVALSGDRYSRCSENIHLNLFITLHCLAINTIVNIRHHTSTVTYNLALSCGKYY